MLTSTTLFDTHALRVFDVRCAHAPEPWADVETSPGSALIFPRRGSFRRRSRYGEEVVEPGVAILQPGGEEEEFAHPHAGGDDCTSLRVSDELLAALLVEPALPGGAIPTTAHEDLAHRRIVAGARRGEDVEEAAIALLASVLGRAAPERAAGRATTAAARRALAADAREALAVDPTLSLVELGRVVGSSPHHLSRVFRAEVGVPVSRYRRQLRLRDALERLGDGDLARVAADAGFADHAHFAREARALLGATPSELRGDVAGAVQQPGQRALEDA